MALRVLNGAVSWEDATLQISNLADIRKFEKKYVRNIPLPYSQEGVDTIGKVAVLVGLAYTIHFFLNWHWVWYLHPLSILISIGGGFLYYKLREENQNSPTQEIKSGYFVCLEKNSGTKEYFGSENKIFIDELYDSISAIMHNDTDSNS